MKSVKYKVLRSPLSHIQMMKELASTLQQCQFRTNAEADREVKKQLQGYTDEIEHIGDVIAVIKTVIQMMEIRDE